VDVVSVVDPELREIKHVEPRTGAG
jgi:hypothetical protein